MPSSATDGASGSDVGNTDEGDEPDGVVVGATAADPAVPVADEFDCPPPDDRDNPNVTAPTTITAVTVGIPAIRARRRR